ncbi:OmpA family protein [Sphingomonas fennica]|uniref:OmpA family protein n=2 Tax=Alphaproteobacteria TaxID=28211 RepID=A0A2T4HT82_9SPHN|nr:OmpA family protein [Sphingomonas fennica]
MRPAEDGRPPVRQAKRTTAEMGMVRLIFLSLFLLLVAAGALALRSCDARSDNPVPEEAPLNAAVADVIVGLPNGATLVAQKGTVGRQLIEWLAMNDGKAMPFELGGKEFLPGSTNPTVEDSGRLPRLVMMLKAYPDVDVQILGHARASGDERADIALSEARARFVVDRLRKEGIGEDRLSAKGVGSSQPLPPDSPLRAGGATDDRVSLVLVRRAAADR